MENSFVTFGVFCISVERLLPWCHCNSLLSIFVDVLIKLTFSNKSRCALGLKLSTIYIIDSCTGFCFLDWLIVWSIKHTKNTTVLFHNFPESKVTSSNCWFVWLTVQYQWLKQEIIVSLKSCPGGNVCSVLK